MATKSQLQKALDECREKKLLFEGENTALKIEVQRLENQLGECRESLAECEGRPAPTPTPPPEPTPQPVPGVWRPFAADAVFNKPIPANPPIDANSKALCDQYARDHATPYVSPTDAWTHPLVWAKPTDPQYKIVLRNAASWGTSTSGETIRIPAHAQPEGPNAAGADSHLSVIQPDGMCFDFWSDGWASPVERTIISGNTITASWGGKGPITGNGLGMKACAAQYGLAAGLVTGAELKAGKIEHALVAVSKAGNNGLTKNGAAGPNHYNGKSTAPAMGQRFMLLYTDAEIAALNVNGHQRTIIRALARYGFLIIDNGGGFCKYESQYTVYEDGSKHVLYDLLGGRDMALPIDWSRLRALA